MIVDKNNSFHFSRVNKYSIMSPKFLNNTKINTKCYEKHQFFQTIFLCYYNSKYSASEPFFIEEMEEKKGGKSQSDFKNKL